VLFHTVLLVHFAVRRWASRRPAWACCYGAGGYPGLCGQVGSSVSCGLRWARRSSTSCASVGAAPRAGLSLCPMYCSTWRRRCSTG